MDDIFSIDADYNRLSSSSVQNDNDDRNEDYSLGDDDVSLGEFY